MSQLFGIVLKFTHPMSSSWKGFVVNSKGRMRAPKIAQLRQSPAKI